MADSGKKRVITINGPIASGKQKLAKLFALSCKSPKIVKMSKAKIQEYYAIASANDSKGYERFLKNECVRMTDELSHYLEDDNENDALIIITDISSLINVLATHDTAPKISDDARRDLVKLEAKYLDILEKNAIQIYVCTDVKPKLALYDMSTSKKDEIPKDFFTLKDVESQHTSCDLLTNQFLLKHDFLNDDGEENSEKSIDTLYFEGREFNFHVYKI